MKLFFLILITSFTTMIGGLFGIKLSKYSNLLSSFAAGSVVGVGIFDLLPESAELNNLKKILPFISIGFGLYFIINNWFSLSKRTENNCDNKFHNYCNVLALCAHSICDGLMIGLTFKVNPAIGIAVSCGIIFHDLADGFNAVTIVNNNKLKWLLIDSIMPFIGVGISLLINPSKILMSEILAIFTGMFLYLGASILVPECHKSNVNRFTNCFLFSLGILFMYLIV